MSSSAFLSCLKPDPRLRLFVVVCGQLSAAAAVLIILTMTMPVAVRAAGCAVCVLYATYELRKLQNGFRNCLELRVSAGGVVWLQDAGQRWLPVKLQNGSIVLRHYGWLRLASADGRRFCEPLCGDAGRDADWRRLQVIWRHIGAA